MTKKPSAPRVWIAFDFLDDPDFSNSHLLVYGYLLNRYNFFKSIRKQFFENISDISAATRQSPATVKRVIKDLQEKGYLQVGKVKTLTGHSNNYVVIDKHRMSNTSQTTKVAVAAPKQASFCDLEEIEEPF